MIEDWPAIPGAVAEGVCLVFIVAAFIAARSSSTTLEEEEEEEAEEEAGGGDIGITGICCDCDAIMCCCCCCCEGWKEGGGARGLPESHRAAPALRLDIAEVGEERAEAERFDFLCV